MESLLLLTVGLLLGLLFGIRLFRWLVSRAGTRIVLARLTNWTNVDLPPGCRQLVQHGRWISEIDRKQK